jgi:hypothetical protein
MHIKIFLIFIGFFAWNQIVVTALSAIGCETAWRGGVASSPVPGVPSAVGNKGKTRACTCLDALWNFMQKAEKSAVRHVDCVLSASLCILKRICDHSSPSDSFGAFFESANKLIN